MTPPHRQQHAGLSRLFVLSVVGVGALAVGVLSLRILDRSDSSRSVSRNAAGDEPEAPGRKPEGPRRGTARAAKPVAPDLSVVEPEESESRPPKDPPERGDCRVLIRVRDRRTGRGVDGILDLWRLGAPANEHWTAGDQLQQTVRTEVGEVEVWHLPVGTYRAVVGAAAADAEDPPAFEVGPAVGDVMIECEVPRMFESRVRLVTPQGIPMRQARVRERSYLALDKSRRPAWIVPRTLRDGRSCVPDNPPILRRQPDDPAWHDRDLDNGMLSLGAHRAPSKAESNQRFYEIEIEGYSAVHATVGAAANGDLDLLAVCVSDQAIRDAVSRWQAGIPSSASVRACSQAVVVDGVDWISQLNGIPVHVEIDSEDWGAVSGTYALDGTFTAAGKRE